MEYGKRLAGQAGRVMESAVGTLLKLFSKITKKNVSSDQYAACLQFVRFGIVGVSNTVISYLIYVSAIFILRSLGFFKSMDYLIAQVIAFILSVLWSYYWNNKMVFQTEKVQKRSWWRTLLKTYVSYSFTGLFLSSVLLALWVQIFHISEFVAPWINLIISVPVNFLLNKFWAFR